MPKYIVMVGREKIQQAEIEVEAIGMIEASNIAVKMADSDEKVAWTEDVVNAAHMIDVRRKETK